MSVAIGSSTGTRPHMSATHSRTSPRFSARAAIRCRSSRIHSLAGVRRFAYEAPDRIIERRAPRSFVPSPYHDALNAPAGGLSPDNAGTGPATRRGGTAVTEEWHEADDVIEAQEATEDEAATRAAEHGKADAEGVLEQSGDAGLQGTEEGAAWTPGSDTPNAGRRER